jgi:hypothetical protein
VKGSARTAVIKEKNRTGTRSRKDVQGMRTLFFQMGINPPRIASMKMMGKLIPIVLSQNN